LIENARLEPLIAAEIKSSSAPALKNERKIRLACFFLLLESKIARVTISCLFFSVLYSTSREPFQASIDLNFHRKEEEKEIDL
jgi:hypothetical protein